MWQPYGTQGQEEAIEISGPQVHSQAEKVRASELSRPVLQHCYSQQHKEIQGGSKLARCFRPSKNLQRTRECGALSIYETGRAKQIVKACQFLKYVYMPICCSRPRKSYRLLRTKKVDIERKKLTLYIPTSFLRNGNVYLHRYILKCTPCTQSYKQAQFKYGVETRKCF